MSVHLKCDRCGRDIPYAEDVDVLMREGFAWWDAVKQDTGKQIIIKSDAAVQVCMDCGEAFLAWLTAPDAMRHPTNPKEEK